MPSGNPRKRILVIESVATVRLRQQKPERIGHPWVFAGEIAHIPEQVEDGDVVLVVDNTGHPLGSAYINRVSKITLRYLTHLDIPIDGQWWYDQLAAAVDRRAFLYDTDRTDAVRLVNGESDGLPGLIVDRYAGVLVVQMLALGLEPWRELIVEALLDLVRPSTIWERSDVNVRELEGLEQRSGLLAGREPPPLMEIVEGEARMLVDVRGGQKTGMFLDQRRNRMATATYAQGANVLNCFAYSGAFGVHAGLAGARRVVNADISAEACDLANRNMDANGLQNLHEAIEANCFDLLRELSDGDSRFDMVILDPPAFTKSRATVDGALRGYKEINLRAMRLLRRGGILVTCSCSQHIDDALFKHMLGDAARDARKEVRIFEQRGQGPDHPILLHVPESQYLICVIAEVQ
jgi:23S rRNA (cytosine1962-C5)-methyltransferase